MAPSILKELVPISPSSPPPTAAHRVRAARAGLCLPSGAACEEGGSAVVRAAEQGARDVALPDGLPHHRRITLRAAAPPTASAGTSKSSFIIIFRWRNARKQIYQCRFSVCENMALDPFYITVFFYFFCINFLWFFNFFLQSSRSKSRT